MSKKDKTSIFVSLQMIHYFSLMDLEATSKLATIRCKQMTVTIDRFKTAIVIIDMQNDFVAKGAPIECAAARNIVKPIRHLISTAHTYKIPVIYTQEVHRQSMVDFGLELDYGEPVHCLEGESGSDFFEPLRPRQQDYVIHKRRYSAFFATDLEILLKGLEVDTLILAGVATDVCVRATAQDGHQLNYKVLVMPECVAGTTVKRHQAALDNIAYLFGAVIPQKQLMEILLKPADERVPA